MPDPRGASRRERREIELARQYAASADVLWYAGHRCAAIHHAERSLYHAMHLPPSAETGVSVAAEGERDDAELSAGAGASETPDGPEHGDCGDPESSGNLSSEGITVEQWLKASLSALSAQDRERLRAGAKHFAEHRVPEVDRDVPLRGGAYFRALIQVQQAALRGHLHKLHTRFGVWLRRFRTVLLLVIVAGLVAYGVTRPPVPAIATASSSFSATYPASAVIDGKFESRTNEWILPHSRKVGWVEVKLGTPETIDKVRIKNASHPPHHTYGAKTFRLEAYEGGKLAFKQEGSFGKPDVKSPWFTSDKIGKRVDRIRVYVLTNYGPAGGIAEITWD